MPKAFVIWNNLQTKVFDAKRQLLKSNRLITSALLKSGEGKTERPKMLPGHLIITMTNSKKLVGEEVSQSTLERYKTFAHMLYFLR